MDTTRWKELVERNDALTRQLSLEIGNAARANWEDVKTYVKLLHDEILSLHGHGGDIGAEPSIKKRKLDVSNGTSSADNAWSLLHADLTIPDVSFSVPMRKKMEIGLVGGSGGGLRVVDQKTASIEASMAWTDIEQIVAVAVPEKAAPAHNFLFIPRDNSKETIVSTLPDTPATSFRPSSTPSARAPNIDPATTLQSDALIRWIATSSAGRCQVIEPSPDEFLSALIQPHKSSVKPAHAKAFRGSKDGFLFLLAPGIVFGFRKPVLWFPFDRIVSVSYTSVLQRTFNMVVAARGVEAGKAVEEEIEYEFAMLDQADFAGIDAYVKKHGLQDRSLADARRAKRYGVNDPKRRLGPGDGDGEATEHDGNDAGILAKTEQQLQDEQDEEEEDFDPGSEGDSDGSGSDSEEEQGGDGGQGPGDYDEAEEFEYDVAD